MSSPLDFNTTWWQEQVYNASAMSQDQDEEDLLSYFEKGEELFLPWSCCAPIKEKTLLDMDIEAPRAMANTIRERLKQKVCTSMSPQEIMVRKLRLTKCCLG